MKISDMLEKIDFNNRRLNELRPLENQTVIQALDIEYTYESNRIEGNTLTLLLQKGYTIANIAGDSETRLQYYNALEKCNRESNKTDFINFVAEQVVLFQDKLISLA